MARNFTPRDAHALMNQIVKEATGQNSIAVVDTSTFVSAGETVLATGIENTLNALNIVLGRTFMAVRPYNAKLRLINAINTDGYTNRMRKISFYSQDTVAAGFENTNLYTNLAENFTAGENPDSQGVAQSVKSMWEQYQPQALEMNFGGSSVWDFPITIYEEQLKAAFRSESEFISFTQGIMVERGNDIESQKEAWNRMAILNKIGSVYDMSANMPGSVINLTSAFNTRFGTQYTSAQLRTTYLAEFLAFFVSTFKLVSDNMELRSLRYHWSPAKTVNGNSLSLLRHTPKDRQRVLLYSPLFVEAESMVLPQIFHDDYLKVENYEGVLYWQSPDTTADPAASAKVQVTPAVTDPTTGLQIAGADVKLDYVVGMIYDVDGLMTDFQFESAVSTPVEARKLYRNVWHHNKKNVISDNTENVVLFIMAD